MSGATGAVPEAPRGRIRRLTRLAVQYAKFGAVGLAATMAHVFCFVALIEAAGLAPLMANIAAFAIAVSVSFVGHFHWTFRPEAGGTSAVALQSRRPSTAMARFVVVALVGLALNSLVVYVVVDALALPYPYAAVLMILVVPAVVFGLSKLWAFA